ncbi:hypothetical protein [Jidongwangia harbinensis]|uniref:hypothetical protein n=1 Tax=Jidongwangia harbinensis TaxID=2878561 RepID=UPI001CD9FDF9|nr:hypothetical protein [Jidongwangia harbinensis]MCA2211571.1 hypothetical protein [Jidongwangia harbinensis]
MDLIGRARELAAVRRLVDRGGTLAVVGPAGSGKTALLEAAAEMAGTNGLAVARAADQVPSGPHLLLLDEATPVPGERVLVTSTDDVGAVPQLRLTPLTRDELVALLPALTAEQRDAVWLATAGWPGPALELAALVPAERPVVALALSLPSRAEFLTLDVALIRLLEEAASRPAPPAVRARVLVRLARELLGDPSAADRRETLIGQALALADDPGTTGYALDGRLHALWDPAATEDRLSTSADIVELGRRAGDAALQRRGLMWRFTALAELGDLDAAAAALTMYARAGELDGDAEAGVVTLTRQALLAMIRGRFDLAERLIARAAGQGRRAGLADTARLTASLTAALAGLRGDPAGVDGLEELARRLPGHFFEATAARVLAESGRVPEALLELDRLLPAVLAGTGPRWLGAVADLAFVAARGGPPAAAGLLYDTLSPYAGRLVVWGGANMITGPVDDYLGRLAAHLGRPADAAAHFDRAVAVEERLGALPWLVSTLTARGRAGDAVRARDIAARLGVRRPAAWSLVRDGDDWLLSAGTEQARLRDVRGLHFLRTLVSAPGREIAALDLVAGGAGLPVCPPDPILDRAARDAFRRRLTALDGLVAEAVGQRRDELTAERSALIEELRRATGLGGRPRRPTAEAERARVNATRALHTVLNRLDAAAPLVAAHLRASLRTGGTFRYQPAPGGPDRWQV